MSITCRKVESASQCGMRNVASPKPQAQRLALSDEQMNHLIGASQSNHDLHDAVVLVLHSGLRVRELANLRWKDVDLTVSRLNVAGRTVPLDSTAASALQNRHQRTQPMTEFVFGAKASATIKRVARQVRALGDRIGTRLVFHDLRHAWAMRLIRFGVSPLALCNLAGWRVPSFLGNNRATLQAAIEEYAKATPQAKERQQ